MIEVSSASPGSDVRIRLKCYDVDDALADADSTPTITITSGEPDYDTAVITAAAMTHNGTGTYDYWWDTDSMGSGAYKIIANATVDGHSVAPPEFFRIT